MFYSSLYLSNAACGNYEQCEAITKSGERCKKHLYPHSFQGRLLCWVHENPSNKAKARQLVQEALQARKEAMERGQRMEEQRNRQREERGDYDGTDD